MTVWIFKICEELTYLFIYESICEKYSKSLITSNLDHF